MINSYRSKEPRWILATVLAAIFLITGLPAIGADENVDPWFEAWRNDIGNSSGDLTPRFGPPPTEAPEEPEDEESKPQKKFVSPAASDAKVPGETDDRPRKRFVSPAASDAKVPGEVDSVTDTATRVARLDPNISPLNALISEWLRIAEPPINATDGARAYYDEYGRMLGQLVGAIARADRKPDDVGARSSQEYVWSFRDRLDSVDHCTLGTYVSRKTTNQSIDDCRGRYKPIVRNVVGMTKRKAGIKLSELGLNGIVLRKRTSARQPPGTSENDMIVESTNPPAGTTVERNSTVYIVLRDSATEKIAKNDPESAGNINPFDGGDNSWIDTMRGREGKRSEKNAVNSQIAAAPQDSTGSTGRPGFTSDDLLDDIEKMTGGRPDVGGSSVAATQTNVSGGNEPSATPDPSPTPEPREPAQSPASTPSPEPRKPTPTPVSTPVSAPQKPTQTPVSTPTPVPQKPMPTPISTPSPVPQKPAPTPTSTPTPTPTPTPTATPLPPKNRTIMWNAPTLCEQNEGVEYRYRWMVSLKQSGTQVTGNIYFHKCPGGGRLSYRLAGEEQKDGSFVMRGTKSGGRGGLYGTAPYQSTFTLREGRTPSPSY